MALRISVGLYGVQQLYGDQARSLVDVAVQVDEAGLDQINLVDHVVMGERTDRYPYGPFPAQSGYPWYEPMVAMSAIAGATRRLRVSTGILITPLRSAVLLAKQAATLDAISGGRLDLGVGTGWQREEYEASGVPFLGRMQRMEDQLRACRALWSDSPASFRSPTVSFERIWSDPKPVQQPVPLWFGIAVNEVAARRVAELGVGWLPISNRCKDIAPGVALLRRAFEQAGRDPRALRVRAQPETRMDGAGRPDLEKTIAGIGQSLEAGVSDLEFSLFQFVRSRDELADFLARLVRLKQSGQ